MKAQPPISCPEADEVLANYRFGKQVFEAVLSQYPIIEKIVHRLDRHYLTEIEKPPSHKQLVECSEWQRDRDMRGIEVWFCPETNNYPLILEAVNENDVVLDACAGDLRLSLLLSQICKKVYAVEINPNLVSSSLRIIGRNLPKNLIVTCADIQQFPLPKDVTLIVLLHIHYSHTPPKDWSNHRVITTQGKFSNGGL